MMTVLDSRTNYLGSNVDLRVESIEKATFGGECPHCDYAFEELTELRKNWRASIGFHSSEITTSVQILDGKSTIEVSDDESRENERGKEKT
jgi:hypothetical protein